MNGLLYHKSYKSFSSWQPSYILSAKYLVYTSQFFIWRTVKIYNIWPLLPDGNPEWSRPACWCASPLPPCSLSLSSSLLKLLGLSVRPTRMSGVAGMYNPTWNSIFAFAPSVNITVVKKLMMSYYKNSLSSQIFKNEKSVLLHLENCCFELA